MKRRQRKEDGGTGGEGGLGYTGVAAQRLECMVNPGARASGPARDGRGGDHIPDECDFCTRSDFCRAEEQMLLKSQTSRR